MPFADLHCDTISRLLHQQRAGQPTTLRQGEPLQVNLTKLRRSGYTLQNFALFVDLHAPQTLATSPWSELQALARRYWQEVQENRDWLHPVLSARDLTRAQETGKLAAVLTVEEGGVCQGALSHLRTLYRLGVRMLTLSWNYENELAHPNGQQGGLTETGFAFLEEMEALGIIPDVSHLGDQGFWDVCRQAKRPFVASHSNCRALYPHRRNLTDEMLRALGDRGGLVGVNFYAGFLDGGPLARTGDILRHLRHVIDVGGLDVVALGSDFDGIDTPVELGDAGTMERLTTALEQGGFTPREIDALCWGNVWRFYGEWLA